jgi:EAL domain-containing protein (putative c-di-GMP-specific phosphodiesterase class I)
MEGLRVEGVRFALDDFGSGFCSFGYLRTLPVDYIKIDGSFVRDLAADPGDRAIVRAIVEVSKSLGKQTVAECVESEAVRAMVAALEVDYAQGFALHRPESLESLLDTRKLAGELS